MTFYEIMQDLTNVAEKIAKNDINDNDLIDVAIIEENINDYYHFHKILTFADYKLLTAIEINLTLKIQEILTAKNINY